MTRSPMPTGRSPRSGDRVRAVADDRDARSVEGILYLRHVPSPEHVQVQVLVDGGLWLVTPESIEVLVPQEVAVEDLEALDPLVGRPSRRRISDLADAAESGLLPESTRVGGTWDDLLDELELRARPMLDAGWRLFSTDQEESWRYGDSVFYDLERDGLRVELEYYEHGQLVAYPLLEEPDDDVTEPIFSIHDSTPESALREFLTHGFVSGAAVRDVKIVRRRGTDH